MKQTKIKHISTTALSKKLGITPKELFAEFTKLGWVERKNDTWVLTDAGLAQKATYKENKQYGKYIVWPENLEIKTNSETTDFRNKFPAKHRATDGHFTRSKAEMLIDNWLYMFEVVHAYERKLPIEEEVYSDFYIPTGKVYIEYWGYENDSKYLERKKIKQNIYKKYNLNLIELEDKDIQNLDDILPSLLLKYGIQTY
jgi:hypothetical protein